MSTKATIFDLGEVDLRRPNVDIIEELALSLREEFPERYCNPRNRHALATINSTRKTFRAQETCWCERVVRASVRRSSDGAVLELGLGNEFSDACSAAELEANPDFRKWKKAASVIRWQEYVDSIRAVLIDLQDIGWYLPLAAVTSLRAEPPIIHNGATRVRGYPRNLSSLVRKPIRRADASVVGVKAAWSGAVPENVSTLLAYGGSPLFSGSPKFRAAHVKDEIPASIILLPDRKQLRPDDDEIGLISECERRGERFAVCKVGSLSNEFARANILFGLAMALGAVPWTTPLKRERVISALDAGHNAAARKSRWAIAQYRTDNCELDVRVRDGALEENLDDFLSDEGLSIDPACRELWRDGKLHARDRGLITQRFQSDGVVELVKHPDVALFRGSLASPDPPEAGDAVVGPDGSVLLQNSPASRNAGYHAPVRARTDDYDIAMLCDDLLALTCRPTRSLYHLSSLPAPVYFADRASKLSLTGWLKAVGNGWRLPPV